MRRKRFYDAVRDLIRDVADEPQRQRPRLSIESLLAAPVKCGACWEEIADSEVVPFSCNACLGAYCVSCLQGYGRAALRDRSLLPLRCADGECRSPVPLSSVTPLLSADEGEQLTRFQQERAAPSADTAAAAAAAADEEDRARVLRLMSERGWRQCPDCGMGIERTRGCAHMVCVCGSEFCYLCGNRWQDAYDCPRHCRNFGADLLDGALPGQRDNFDVMRDDVWMRIVETINELRAVLRAEEAAAPRPVAQAVLPTLPILALVADQYGERQEGGNGQGEGGEERDGVDEVRGGGQSSGKMSVGALVHPYHA